MERLAEEERARVGAGGGWGPRRVALIVALLAAGWFIYGIREILTPFVLAFLLAYLLNPLVERLGRLHIPRLLAIVLILLSVGSLLVLALAILVPLVQEQILNFADRVPRYLAVFEGWIDVAIRRLGGTPPEQVRAFVLESLRELGNLPRVIEYGRALLSRATSGLINVLFLLVYVVLVPVLTFYLLRDFHAIRENFFSLVPSVYQEEARLRMARLDEVMGGFIKGQFFVGLVLAVLYSVGLMLVATPLWLVLGIGTGLLSMVPYLGLILGFPTALIMSALQYQDLAHPIGVVGVFAVVWALDGWFVSPRIVGGHLGLHPVVIILAVFAGAHLMGIFGVLIAMPAAAAIRVGLEALRDHYLR
ncbi:MAG: AI-2E family transporter [Nitrospinota bacterium]